MKAVLASQNLHKLEELREALPGWEIEALEADGYPEETGETYYENALLKARFGRALAGRGVWVLGEDSGIECDALDGAPGLHSARWAPGRDQADALLERLAGEPERGARMVTELVALSPDGVELRGSGVLEGELATGAARQRRLRLRPDLHPGRARRGRSPRSGTAWKRLNSHRARAAHALLAAIAARRRLAEVVVDLGAEDDHVRHHVEPDEQHRRARERLQHRVVLRGAHEGGQELERRLEQHRRDRRRRGAPRASRARRS